MGHADDQELIPLRPAFDIVRRGYNRSQVEERIEELQADLRIVLADSEAGAAQAAELSWQLEATRQELDEARVDLKRLSAPPDTLEGLSERLKRMLRLAKDEAAETLARAEAAAATRMAEAESQAGGLRTRYEEMISEAQQRRAAMETEHEDVLAKAARRAKETVAQAEARTAELDAQAAAKRKQVEEDFEITMSARRTETTRELVELEATSKSEAQRRVDEASEVARRVVTEADQRATTMTSEATRRVDQLRAIRHKVAEQLLSVRTTLDDAFLHLAPLPEEDDAVISGPAGRPQPITPAQSRPAPPGVGQRDHARSSPRQTS